MPDFFNALSSSGGADGTAGSRQVLRASANAHFSKKTNELISGLNGEKKCTVLMEKYESLGVVGEGSYGLVMKCRHRETGQLVAIKKFLETEEDLSVRKMALREIRMLKRLRHENLVNMLEVFRRKRRFYLVFEFMDHTILDELEATGGALEERKCREYIFQVVRGVDFCHSNNVIHRDIKPENVLVSTLGVIKLCDFGFARLLSGTGEMYTDYVATRWYRAPELLVPDSHYGKAVDVWAIGCLFAEMMAGEPLFPGDSDIDQLFLIIKVMGKMSQRHQQLIGRNPMYKGLKRNEEGTKSLSALFPDWSLSTLDFLGCCLKMDPQLRPTTSDLLRHLYLTKDNFSETFLPELRQRILQESQNNPLFRKFQGSAPRRAKENDWNEDKHNRRSSFMELPRWKFNAPDDCRRTSFELNRFLNSSRSKCEPMDEDTENRRWEVPPASPLQSIPGLLHPTISNLCFNSEGPKRSPLPVNVKSVPRKTQLVRKLDRPLDNALFIANRDPITPSPPSWLASKRPTCKDPSLKHLRNISRGGMDEDFSLPNLPGATASPKKGGKKKMTNFGGKEGDLTPTPRNQVSLTPSAGSRSRLNPNFSYM